MKCAETSHEPRLDLTEYDQLPDETNIESESKLVYFATHFRCTAIKTSCSFSFHPETDFLVEIFKNQIVTVESQAKMYLVLNLDQFKTISCSLLRLRTFEPQFNISYVDNTQPITSTQTVDDMTQFYSSFTNLSIIKS